MTAELLATRKEELLEIANEWYNGEVSEPISDLDFDKLERDILVHDPTWDYRNHLDGQGKDIKHYIPMEKVEKVKEETRSMGQVQADILMDTNNSSSPKYDGGGLALYYNNGVLYDAITRSSTKTGKRQFSKVVNMVPQKLVDKDIIAIECETMISLNKGKGDKSRQAATGLLNSNSLQDRCESELTIVAFKVRYKDGVTKDWIKGTKELPIIKDLKSKNVTFMPTPFNEGSYYGNKFKAPNGYEFLIDGIVEHIDGKSLARKLYFNEVKKSVIKKIEWNHTPESLKYVPKYIYEEVLVDGTKCSRATAGGTAQLLAMKCGVGSKVDIIKSGLTIPQVFRLTAERQKYVMNTTGITGFMNDLNVMRDFTTTFYEIKYNIRSIIAKIYKNVDLFIKESPYAKQLSSEFIDKSTQEQIVDAAIDIFIEECKTNTKFKSSENYSLPYRCDCSHKLDLSNDLNGGLYCPNPECVINLHVLETYLKEDGRKLKEVIYSDPISFISKYLKVPRFNGWAKFKKDLVGSEKDFTVKLSSKDANPKELLEKYFDLSELQKDILTVLNPMFMTFYKENLND